MQERLRALLLHRFFPHTVDVDGHPLHIPPGVLDPVLFRSGAWFARQVAARLPSRPMRLLDLGCGSGVVGVLAQQRPGVRVTAVDLSPAAVEAARRNGLSDVRQGDLFAPVAGERFDVVCFNPPYFPGRPSRRGFDLALYGGPRLELVRRFLAALPDALSAEGRGWVVLSDRAPQAIALHREAGWTPLVEEAVAGGEVLSVWAWARTG